MLRDFQADAVANIYRAWAEGAQNVMLTAPTGAGKTVIFGHILRDLNAPAVAIAHRMELVSQICLALNREQVPHGIEAPQAIQRQIITLEMEMFGRSFYQPYAPVRVASVDTLTHRDAKDRWFKQCQTVVIDEGHHVVDNKWSQARAMFPNARGLLVTAHAVRADGKGLGRQADGIVDRLIIGPSARALINRGFLCDYRLAAPASDVDESSVPISAATGDFNQIKLREAVHKSKQIVGDVVGHYLKFAAGKLGLTFAVDLELAAELAAAYRAAGVPAEVISSKTPLFVRGQLMRQFRNRQILQLVNCEVLTEGVDVPAVEVVSLARATASFQLYSQMFGRALRIMVTDAQNAEWGAYTDAQRLAAIAASQKPKALIIDHTGNWQRHGLPDVEQSYTLNRREKRSRGKMDDAIPLRPCMNEACASFLQPYPVVLPGCPVCGVKPIPGRRGTPEQVDGDLFELDPEVLKAMRGEIARIDNPVEIPQNVSGPVALAIRKRHIERQEAQRALRDAWALWQGWQLHQGRGEIEGHKRFFFKFGIDVLSAHALGAPDAAALEARIRDDLRVNNIVEKVH